MTGSGLDTFKLRTEAQARLERACKGLKPEEIAAIRDRHNKHGESAGLIGRVFGISPRRVELIANAPEAA